MSITSARDAWLSLTPEPERELPATVAALRARGRSWRGDEARERARVERLVVRARRGAWLSYLSEVVELIERSAASDDPEVRRARVVAADVVRNHHRLLLGVSGPAAEQTEGERSRLEAIAAETHTSNGG